MVVNRGNDNKLQTCKNLYLFNAAWLMIAFAMYMFQKNRTVDGIIGNVVWAAISISMVAILCQKGWYRSAKMWVLFVPVFWLIMLLFVMGKHGFEAVSGGQR